jgi:hypothetical protein
VGEDRKRLKARSRSALELDLDELRRRVAAAEEAIRLGLERRTSRRAANRR